jgi:hypothetical protein
MRSTWYFLIVGLALVLGPSLASSQFGPPQGGGGFPGGGGGFPGGGRGGRGGRGGGGMNGFTFDPTQMWNAMTGNKAVVTQADAANNPALQRTYERAIQSLGITNGKLTREQFTAYMQQRMAARANPGGPTGSGGPNGMAAATPGNTPPGGFTRGGNNNPWGGGNNQWGNNQWGNNQWGNNQWGGNNQFAANGGNQWGGGRGGWNGGNFDPDTMAEMRFRRLDTDGNGLLNTDELAGESALLSEKDRWDTDNDGFINLSEFKEYFKARVQQYQLAGNPFGRGGATTNPNDPNKATVYRAGKLPPNLPAWFAQYDTDLDGQVGLYEWKAAGQPIVQFEKMDLNGDGFLTVEEVLRSTGALVSTDPNSSGNSLAMGRGNFPGGFGRGNRGQGGPGGFQGFGRGNRGQGGPGSFQGFGRGNRGQGGPGGFGDPNAQGSFGRGSRNRGQGSFQGDPNAQGSGRQRGPRGSGGGFQGNNNNGTGGFPGGGAPGSGRGRGGFGGFGGFPGGGAPSGAMTPGR